MELTSDTSKVAVDVDFVLEPAEKVFYALSPAGIFSKEEKSPFLSTKFYQINISTGETTLINTFEDVELSGLIISDNTLYATGIGISWFIAGKTDASGWGLYEIDPFKGVATPVTPLTGDILNEDEESTGEVWDLTSSSDGKIYSLFEPTSRKGIAVEDTLAEIDLLTGNVTALIQPSNFPYNPSSLSISFSGTKLYLVAGGDDREPISISKYYEWENYTGTSSLAEIADIADYGYFSGMAYYNGNIYVIGYKYDKEPGDLLSIAPETGAVTVIGSVASELGNYLLITDMVTKEN